MTIQDWDGDRRAPAGKFRVIGSDDFPQPPEEYLLDDFVDAVAAIEAATKVGAMALAHAVVYDDRGQVIDVRP